MTRESPSMISVRDAVIDYWGRRYYLGIIGDQYHFYGYHLGPQDVPDYDLSMVLPRDINGAKLGNYASAIDIGMGFKDSRRWLLWLVKEAQKGTFPDLAEIIGSVDGGQDFLWDSESAFRSPAMWHGDHVEHTHLSFFRDSVFRDQSGVVTKWRPKPKLSTPTQAPPRPSVSPSPKLSAPTQTVRTDWHDALLPVSLVGAGVAWVIKRRREAGL